MTRHGLTRPGWPAGLARVAGLAAVMAAGAVGGCAGRGGETGSAGDAIEVVDDASARAAIGRIVSIEGEAGNGKISLVVMRGDLLVFCLDQTWRYGKPGQRVRVRGRLEVTDQLRARQEGDEITQGTNGNDLVIRRCQIE
jgi:hypothetical protein